MERTEGEALSGLLHITLGGEPIELRTLTLDESDGWLAMVAQEVADIEVDEEGAADVFRSLLTRASRVILRLIAAYDKDGILGGEEGIRARHPRKRELLAAIEAMMDAEDPFEPGAVRSVVAAFGAPSVSLWRVTGALAAAAAMQALSTGGRSPASASDGATSDAPGPASSSSSDGPIPMRRRAGRKRSA